MTLTYKGLKEVKKWEKYLKDEKKNEYILNLRGDDFIENTPERILKKFYKFMKECGYFDEK